MYDAQPLTALLLSAGFTDIQRKTSGESLIENIAAVEDPSRILDGAGVCIEARKPCINVRRTFATSQRPD